MSDSTSDPDTNRYAIYIEYRLKGVAPTLEAAKDLVRAFAESERDRNSPVHPATEPAIQALVVGIDRDVPITTSYYHYGIGEMTSEELLYSIRIEDTHTPEWVAHNLRMAEIRYAVERLKVLVGECRYEPSQWPLRDDVSRVMKEFTGSLPYWAASSSDC